MKGENPKNGASFDEIIRNVLESPDSKQHCSPRRWGLLFSSDVDVTTGSVSSGDRARAFET